MASDKYWDKNKSINAQNAEIEGRYPKSIFKQKYGIDPSKLATPSEWHHSSKYFNKVDYYSLDDVFDALWNLSFDERQQYLKNSTFKQLWNNHKKERAKQDLKINLAKNNNNTFNNKQSTQNRKQELNKKYGSFSVKTSQGEYIFEPKELTDNLWKKQLDREKRFLNVYGSNYNNKKGWLDIANKMKVSDNLNEQKSILLEGKVEKIIDEFHSKGISLKVLNKVKETYGNHAIVLFQYFKEGFKYDDLYSSESKLNIAEITEIEDFLNSVADDYIANTLTGIRTSIFSINVFIHILKTEDNRPQKIDKSLFQLDEYNDREKVNFNTIASNWTYVTDWRDNPNVETPNLRTMTWQEAFDKAYEWHESLKASGKSLEQKGKVILKFPDGYYWLDLQTNDCEEEADSMGHCGRTGADTLLSLRTSGGVPVMTVAYNYNGTYTQAKGSNNKKPIKKYWNYFLELIKELEITDYDPEYSSDEDLKFTDFPTKDIINAWKKNNEISTDKDLQSKIYVFLIDKISKELNIRDYSTSTVVNITVNDLKTKCYDDMKILHDLIVKYEYEYEFNHNQIDLLLLKLYPEDYKILLRNNESIGINVNNSKIDINIYESHVWLLYYLKRADLEFYFFLYVLSKMIDRCRNNHMTKINDIINDYLKTELHVDTYNYDFKEFIYSLPNRSVQYLIIKFDLKEFADLWHNNEFINRIDWVDKTFFSKKFTKDDTNVLMRKIYKLLDDAGETGHHIPELDLYKPESEIKENTQMNESYILFEEIEKTDLYQLFDVINQKYFDNAVKPVEIKWTNQKNSLGTAIYRYNTKKCEIRMSKFFEVTYETLKNTMAHEMIHVYLYQQGEMNHGHGRGFIYLMNLLNSKGLNITIKNSDDIPLNQVVLQNRNKPIWIILMKRGNDGLISVYTGKNIDEIIEWYSSKRNQDGYKKMGISEIIIGKTSDKSVLTYKTARTLKGTFDRYKTKKERFEELKTSIEKPDYETIL